MQYTLPESASSDYCDLHVSGGGAEATPFCTLPPREMVPFSKQKATKDTETSILTGSPCQTILPFQQQITSCLVKVLGDNAEPN
jgi:hypothetical protein